MEQQQASKYGNASETEAEASLMAALLNDDSTFLKLKALGVTGAMFFSSQARVLYDIIATFYETNHRVPISTEIQRYVRVTKPPALDMCALTQAANRYTGFEDISILGQYIIHAYVKRTAEADLYKAVEMIEDPTKSVLSVLQWLQCRVTECSSAVAPQTDDQAEIDQWTYDTADDEEEPRYLMSINNGETIPERSITAVTGKAKAGKSNYIMLLISAMINKNQDNICGVRSLIKLNRILYIDTEQPRYAVRKKFRRMLRTAGYDAKTSLKKVGIHLLTMRGADTEKRLDILRKTVKKEQPQIIFIDGIVDLCKDFNDVSASSSLIAELMALTEQGITLVCLLHENEGNAATKMRGHLGTILLQKCDDMFVVSSSNGRFKVKHLGRETMVDDLEFRIEDGIYTSRLDNEDDKRNFILQFFKEKNTEIVSRAELHKALMGRFRAAGNSTVDRWLRTYIHGDDAIMIYDSKTKRYKLTKPF